MSLRSIGPGSTAGLTSTARVKVSVVFTDAQGVFPVDIPEMTNAYSVRRIETENLVINANTITVPPAVGTPTGKAGGVIIIPPLGNTSVLTLKGIDADTGVELSLTGVQVITFDATPPANFVINASAAVSGVTFIWF